MYKFRHSVCTELSIRVRLVPSSNSVQEERFLAPRIEIRDDSMKPALIVVIGVHGAYGQTATKTQ